MKKIKLKAKYFNNFNFFEFSPLEGCEYTKAFFNILCYYDEDDERYFQVFEVFEWIKKLGLSCTITVENEDTVISRLLAALDAHNIDSDGFLYSYHTIDNEVKYWVIYIK